MVICGKPPSFPDEQSKMRYAFKWLSGLTLKHTLSQVRENGDIELADLQAVIYLLEAAIGDPGRVATAE
jgi:hypothetical protein